MPKLPVTTPKKTIQALERLGFYVERAKGSHYFLLHPAKPHLQVTIPFHSKDLPPKTLKSILKQAELTVKEFTDLL